MVRLEASALERFGKALLERAGVSDMQAGTVSANLAWNDAAGRHNHGFERLPVLLDRVAAGGLAKAPILQFDPVTDTMARLDADGAFGQHAGTLAMDHACEVAERHGIGVVGVANSNFYGTGAAFVARATGRGMIALALSNSYPKVAAPGGAAPVLGTNPFAFGAPLAGGDLVVDFSTAALAGSTLRAVTQAGGTLPEGMLVDASGAPVTDPARAEDATLLPAAGGKGFGLALMVEVFAGVLTGAGIGAGVGSLYGDLARPSDNGHLFLALDPARWLGADFAPRMGALADMVRSSAPEGVVRLPGAARWAAIDDAAQNGVAVPAQSWAELRRRAADAGVTAPEVGA